MTDNQNKTDRNQQMESMFKQAEAFTGPAQPEEQPQKRPMGCGIFMLIILLVVIAFLAIVLIKTGSCTGA